MRWESSNRLFALALRTWHFASTLARAGHEVLTFAVRGHAFEGWPHDRVTRVRRGRVSVWNVSEHLCHERPELIRQQIEAFRPDAVVGVNRDPAAIAVNFSAQLPFWADINGDPMAEAQVKASSLGGDWAINEWYRTLVPVLCRADRFSTCSRAQRHALIAQLGMLGRLTAKNDGYEFVTAIPNSMDDEELELLGQAPRTLRGPGDPFVVLWSGGYNTWTDPDALFGALELAMDELPELRFVSTGGAIPGHHLDAYARFETLVARSNHRHRYRLAGWVQTAELPAYYAGAHAAILVDRFSYEGTLGARTRMLDWLAAGLPIVSTRLSEISLDLEQAGAAILAEPGDSAGLARGLVELAREPAAARERGERGRAFAVERCRAELQLASLVAWAKAPERAPDLEHRVPLEWLPSPGSSVRKHAALLRAELRQHGPRAALEKAGVAGLRKLGQSAASLGARLGLSELAPEIIETPGTEVPPLEAPRFAAFQWQERLAKLDPVPAITLLLLVDDSTEPHVLDWTLKQLELQYLTRWRLLVATVGALPPEHASTLETCVSRMGASRAEVVRVDRVDLGEHRLVRSADWVLLFGAGTLLRPDALAELVTSATAGAADVVYGNERSTDWNGVPAPAVEKPDFSADLLLRRPYLGSAVLYRGQVLSLASARAGEWPIEAVLHDAALRSTERGTRVVRVPVVLCQVWQRPWPEAELVRRTQRRHSAELAATRDALLRRGIDAWVESGTGAGTFRVRFAPVTGRVVIAVPESRAPSSVERTLSSLRRLTRADQAELVRVRSPGNLPGAARSADVVVWVDASLEALHDDWLHCLLEELANPGTVAASPKLVSPSGAPSFTGDGLHAGVPADFAVARTIRAPHPLCFAVRREALAATQLPFERARLAALLLEEAARWRETGLAVRYTPDAAFCHHAENGKSTRTEPGRETGSPTTRAREEA
jgi:glycosyltransferase involved in cell wall biosynthesis